jgi:hypothetical protein
MSVASLTTGDATMMRAIDAIPDHQRRYGACGE